MPMRLMAAKMMAPLAPDEILALLLIMASEQEEKLRSEAINSLEQMPANMAEAATGGIDSPQVLHLAAQVCLTRVPLFLEHIVLNKNCHDNTIVWLAGQVSKDTAEIIAQNQVRLIRCRELLPALISGGNLSKATTEKLHDFAREHNLPWTEAPGEISKEPEEAPATEKKRREEPDQKEEEKGAEELPQELVEEGENTEVKRESLLSKIKLLSVAQRIKLGAMGNRETRRALISSSNKVIACSVLDNPKLTEHEVCDYAKNKNLNEEVVRRIATNKEWIKNYHVKSALVKNPKTPLSLSLRYLPTLNFKDLINISKTRGTHSVITTTAKKLVAKKKAMR